ncbi:hypothetical protein LUW75_10915 [Streptomyces sp. MRC013]|uniref:hypothetical protein n=1 Tax=Streptomyces sp. MRC013 TaxID=2898276 RepID=UPI002025BDA9|nr:hypothetical protein [Streptomyces sp. MRC013]URM90424.1 hypothetical protein LUW75_10915 [Streptomyces sp. MRC013]
MVFPLDRRTWIYVVGVGWTDITSDVYEREPITITRGRGDEGVRVEPSRCSLVLNNRLGTYSPRNPRSPYAGKIGRNTPIRVTVGGPTSWLDIPPGTTGRASTPDHASLDITGDLDVRIDLSPETWAGGPWETDAIELIGKYRLTSNQRSWRMVLVNNGKLEFVHSTTGSDTHFWQSEPVPHVAGHRGAVRVTLDVNNGAGGHTLTFYTAPSIAGPWTVLSSETRSGTTSLYASTSPLEVGDLSALAFEAIGRRIHAAEVRNGIGGTVVAAPDFTARTPGSTSFADTAGRTWTVSSGASITNQHVRFVGEVASWPTRWDVSGQDVYTTIEAAGVLRRLGQGRKALASTLRRRIPAYSPLAYWPMEDDDGATTAASGLPGGSPLYTLGLEFGAEDSLPGSSALPTVSTGSRLNGAVRAPSPDVPSTEWHLEFVYRLDTAPASKTCILGAWGTGSVRRWYLYLQSGIATVEGYDVEGNLLVNRAVGIGGDLFGQWVRWQLYAQQVGGNVEYTTRWVVVGSSGGSSAGTYPGTIGLITDVVGPPDAYAAGADGMGIGHIAVFDTADTTAYNSADHGFSGETALSRLARLTTEESGTVTVRWIDGDSYLDSERMGPQRPETLLDLLDEAAAADGGLLYEDRTRLGLVYRDRTSFYNQRVALALDYASGREVAPPLEPTEDDQRIRNDVTVKRRGGSWGRAVLESGPLSTLPPEEGGVGLYDEEIELNITEDARAQRLAEWRLHLGTWDEARYPTVRVALHAAPHLIDQAATLDVGDRLTISNPPPWLPPDLIDLLAYGYTETITRYTWHLEMNCAPAGPWKVGVVADAEAGRADTGGCQLTGTITASATSVAVTTTGNRRWIDSATYPGDFPFLVRVGGEVMQVTAVAGTTSAQTLTVVRGVNGLTKVHAAGTAVVLDRALRPIP